MKFRNMITYSYSQDYSDPLVIDNSFYISTIIEVDEKQHKRYLLDEKGKYYLFDDKGNYIMEYQYEQPNRYFLSIPSSKTAKHRLGE